MPQPISNDHYCLISRVSTDKNPNPVPELGTITDFAAYISEHPDMAWRNVVTINPANPESTTQMNYSQGTEGGDVYLIMRCENVPDGSAVSFSSGTPGPDPMIYMQKTTVVNTVGSDGVPRFSLTLLTNIPANWSSNISYTWYSEGKNPLPGLKVWFEAIMPTTTDHPVLGRYARPLAEFGIEAPQIGPTAGIKLGSQLMQTLPVAINSPASRVYGESRRAVPAAETSSVLFSGVSWGQRTSSVFGSSASTFDVAVVREEQSNVVTEVVTLSDATPVQGGNEPSDVAVDAAFESGPYTGMTLATLTGEEPAGRLRDLVPQPGRHHHHRGGADQGEQLLQVHRVQHHRRHAGAVRGADSGEPAAQRQRVADRRRTGVLDDRGGRGEHRGADAGQGARHGDAASLTAR